MGARMFRRQVFFFHGFDRRGARYIHLSHCHEIRRYNRRFGSKIVVGPRSGDTWQVVTDTTQTTFTVCDWSDIVSRRFATPAARVAIDTIGLGLQALRQGFFGKVLRLDWALGLLLLWGFLPFFLALVMTIIFALAAPLWLLSVPFWVVGLHWLAARYDPRLGMAYVGHIAWMSRRIAQAACGDLESFLARSADRIRAADADEVVVVGHSIGAPLALVSASDADRPVTVLTVGPSTPLITLQKDAHAIRQKINGLPEGCWFDVSARKDMLGFLACDPSDGLAQCLTANFNKAFGREPIAALKWNGFRMHFQYFRANLNPAEWDWFGLLTAPAPLPRVLGPLPKKSGRGERRLLF